RQDPRTKSLAPPPGLPSGSHRAGRHSSGRSPSVGALRSLHDGHDGDRLQLRPVFIAVVPTSDDNPAPDASMNHVGSQFVPLNLVAIGLPLSQAVDDVSLLKSVVTHRLFSMHPERDPFRIRFRQTSYSFCEKRIELPIFRHIL